MTSQNPNPELQQAEAWFASVCADQTGPDLDRIKRHVRLAVNEQWLADELDQTSDSNVSADTKLCIRELLANTIGGQQHTPPAVLCDVTPTSLRRTHTMQWLGAASLAAAACLLIAVAIQRTESPAANLVLVSAFEQYEEDDFTQSIASLDQDLDELEAAWDHNESTVDANGYFEYVLDDLDTKLYEAQDKGDWTQSVLEGTIQ